MTARDRLSRWLSPSLFALVGLCFLLPFATVSWDNAKTTFTGVQLVTRTVPAGGMVSEGADCSADLSECVQDRGSLPATVALVSAVVGLALGLAGIAKGSGWCATSGVIALLWLVEPALEPFGPDVRLHAGYDLALLLSSSVRQGYEFARLGDDVRGQTGVTRCPAHSRWGSLQIPVLGGSDRDRGCGVRRDDPVDRRLHAPLACVRGGSGPDCFRRDRHPLAGDGARGARRAHCQVRLPALARTLPCAWALLAEDPGVPGSAGSACRRWSSRGLTAISTDSGSACRVYAGTSMSSTSADAPVSSARYSRAWRNAA